MPSNPMQRKSRNSFFLGMLIMLIIAVVVVGILYITVLKKDEKKSTEEAVIAYVYAVNQEVSSGQEITPDMLQLVEVTGEFSTWDLIPEADLGKISTGYRSKIDLGQGAILNYNMLYEGEELQDSERLVEYNMLTLPVDLYVGDYIDVRLQLANGQDLIVVSRKEVKNIFGNTISLYLTEDEILMLNSAIVEAYIMPASSLYVTKYIEPGMQTAIQLTYVPTAEVQQLINSNPNITNNAKSALQSRFSAEVRTLLTVQTSQYIDDSLSNIEDGIQEQIEAAKAAREAYLSGLSGY